MPEKQSSNGKSTQTAIKTGVITTLVVAVAGLAFMFYERSRSHSDMAGMAGGVLAIMSPAVGIIGAIIGAVLATDNVSYTSEDHADDE